MDLTDIKIVKVDITEWLIKAIYAAKQNESKFKYIFNRFKDIIEFELTHPDFDFFINFDLFTDKGVTDCRIKNNYDHVARLYQEIDFNNKRLEDIYRAVLSHFNTLKN